MWRQDSGEYIGKIKRKKVVYYLNFYSNESIIISIIFFKWHMYLPEVILNEIDVEALCCIHWIISFEV